MTKGGKLTQIRSVLKKMQSFKLGQGAKASSIAAASCNSSSDESSAVSKDLHAVYVGKSRWKYLITSDVMENPLFRQLVDRGSGRHDESITVDCEVVLFEHLLCMVRRNGRSGTGTGVPEPKRPQP